MADAVQSRVVATNCIALAPKTAVVRAGALALAMSIVAKTAVVRAVALAMSIVAKTAVVRAVALAMSIVAKTAVVRAVAIASLFVPTARVPVAMLTCAECVVCACFVWVIFQIVAAFVAVLVAALVAADRCIRDTSRVLP